jgi:ech hydrogenase subunit F
MDKHKAHVSVDLSKCVPCSGLVCVGVCPEGILEQGSDKKPKVVDNASCTLCGVCINLCPTKALTIKQGEKKTEPR